MRKILFLTIFVMGSSYSILENTPYDEARKLANNGRLSSLEKVETDFFFNVKKNNTESEVLVGYLNLLKTKEECGDPNARAAYQNLLKKPNLDSWLKTFEKLSQKTTLFKGNLPTAKGNFSINTIKLVSDAISYLNQKAPISERAYEGDDFDKITTISSLNELQAHINAVSHQIMSGAFGLRENPPADETEANDMISFLIQKVRNDSMNEGDLKKLFENYSLNSMRQEKGASNPSNNAKEHIKICRLILAATYYVQNYGNSLNDHSINEIIKIIGQEWKVDIGEFKRIINNPFIGKILGKNNLKVEFEDAQKKPIVEIKINTSGDFQLQPVNQKLYTTYVSTPQKFWDDIRADVEKYTDRKANVYERYTERDLVLNAIAFLYYTQALKLHTKFNYCAYIDGDIYNDKDPNNILWLTPGDKTEYDYRNYHFTYEGKKREFKDVFFFLDTSEVYDAIKKADENAYYLKSMIWLTGENFSPESLLLSKLKYNLTTVQDGIGKFWKGLYEVLAYAYVFAKEQKKEKPFFHTAFPSELHCTSSLASMMASWLENEKKLIGVNPSQIMEKKLELDAKNIIHAENLFIGSVVPKLIEYFLIPRVVDWYKEQSSKISLDDIERDPALHLSAFEGKAKPLVDQFATIVKANIVKAAKERAVLDCNGKGLSSVDVTGYFSEVKHGFPPHQDPKGWKKYSTTDSDVVVFFKSNKDLDVWPQPKISESDISDVIITVNTGKNDANYNKIYVELSQYLREKYLKYLKDLVDQE